MHLVPEPGEGQVPGCGDPLVIPGRVGAPALSCGSRLPGDCCAACLLPVGAGSLAMMGTKEPVEIGLAAESGSFGHAPDRVRGRGQQQFSFAAHPDDVQGTRVLRVSAIARSTVSGAPRASTGSGARSQAAAVATPVKSATARHRSHQGTPGSPGRGPAIPVHPSYQPFPSRESPAIQNFP
jgi:hypothetical protein